ncbi:heavy metal translocating P-type ATPase metal-binding domain-containing protein, partial [Tahibacter caeni]|uniref:heavy metal translocating P-type ATPase metal-binding domain-containing protein n=1 Tax=Tahibacter caeni TaxID=1453545 RepID=UPI00214942ED
MATVPGQLFSPLRDAPGKPGVNLATAADATPAHEAQASAAAKSGSGCFHCGQALPAQPVTLHIDGAERAVCCDGCGAAARWIRDAGLGQYYRLRQSEASRVDPDHGDFREWMQPDVLAEQAWPVAGGLAIVVLADGLRCAACAWLIDQALLREDGVLDVAANAVSGRIRLSWDPQRVDLCVLLQRLAALGFAPGLSGGSAREQARRRESRRDLVRLGLAGLGAMQAMM